MNLPSQLQTLKNGIHEIIPHDGLENLLNHSKKSAKPLKVKLGADPSNPDLHLGHTLALQKLREFQDLGHQIVFVIGDFTAMIGDPSGQSKTRPTLTKKQVENYSKTYQEQIFKILNPQKTTISFNSTWNSTLSFQDVLNLTSKYTVARMLERDDFSKRFQNQKPITITEFLYCLIQAYDSVFLNADIELGGIDQKFNFILTRHIQKEYSIKPQTCLLLPILDGIDGQQKMSKSLGNYIALNDSPSQFFGKIMSIPDSLITQYFTLLTQKHPHEIKNIENQIQNSQINPRNIKISLAKDIMTPYFSQKVIESAHHEFNQVFSLKQPPQNIPSYTPSQKNIPLVNLLVESQLSSSKSEAKRLILGGGIYINGTRESNHQKTILVHDGMIIKAGKRRFIRLTSNHKTKNPDS